MKLSAETARQHRRAVDALEKNSIITQVRAGDGSEFTASTKFPIMNEKARRAAKAERVERKVTAAMVRALGCWGFRA